MLIRFITRHHLIVVASAVCLFHATLLMFHKQAGSFWIYFLMAMAAFFAYNFSGSAYEQMLYSGSAPKSFREITFDFSLVMLILADAVFFVSLFVIPFKLTITFILLFFLTLVYLAPVEIKNMYYPAFNRIPLFKNTLLAFVWTTATVLVPWVYAGKQNSPAELGIIFAERFFFILALSIPFNIRDAGRDFQNGVQTFATRFGPVNAKAIAFFFMLIFVALSYVHYSLLNLHRQTFIALIISAVCTSVFILLASENKKEWYYEFVLDGSMILQLALILLFSPVHQ